MRISGRHAKVNAGSPHEDKGGADKAREKDPKLTGRTNAMVEVSEFIRSIDVNASGGTDIVTGLNKLGHERLKLLYDLTGTINGTVGVGKGAGARIANHPVAPIAGDESLFIFANAANSDDSYDMQIVFGPDGKQVQMSCEVLFTSFNIQRGDDASLRFTADFELAGGQPSVWEVV